MNKRCFVYLIIFLFSISIQKTFGQTLQRKMNFDGNWKFQLGNASDPSKDFNYSIANIFSKSGKGENTPVNPQFKDSGWNDIQLPHDWVENLPFENSSNFDVMAHGYKPVGGLYPQNSIGWYRKHFNINRKDSGGRFVIQFDGIFRDSKIWINGFYLGNNLSGYIGANYDITDFINYDRENVIVVRADASQYEGWFYEGAGIYRHVWLQQTNNIHLVDDATFIYSKVNGRNATIHIESAIHNQSYDPATVVVKSMIIDRNGRKLKESTSTTIKLNADQDEHYQQTIEFPNARLWSIEDPYLYRIKTVVSNLGKPVDSIITRFGMRTIDISIKGLFVNGKYVKVKGVNNHQDHAGVGSALPDALQYYRVGLLKDMGANAYRTSHNGPTPELLEACDSLGMLVLDEQRLLNSGEEYLDEFDRLIRRDRNHASVFLWSIGNEEGYLHTSTIGKRVALTLLQRQKELDPTRTGTYAADVGNVFRGVNEVIPVRGFNYRLEFVDPYHRDHPEQPVIGTEMGSTVTTRGIYIKDTINKYVPDEDITYPWWANTAEQWWSLAADRTWWMGGFVWTGFDYRGEPTPYEWPNINSHFGIMDMCGFPKNIFYYYQSWWSDKPVLHISTHWNWKGQEGKPIDVWVNSNANKVELFLNNKSLGVKLMPRNRHLQWAVPYEQGVLSAIGYFKDDKKVISKVETSGPAANIILSPSKTSIAADGKDLVIINVSVTDDKGLLVPDAMDMIKFSIEGPAKFIGVGNGDPSSHEPDQYKDQWQRKLFNGKCQIIVQSTTGKGPIKVFAYINGRSTTLNLLPQ